MNVHSKEGYLSCTLYLSLMNENAWRVYRSLGYTFLGIATVFIAVALGERLFKFNFFSGNPIPVALFLAFIGAALLYTIRGGPQEPPPEQPEDPPEQ